jgi:DNA-binding FadR family transcriptional regulator
VPVRRRILKALRARDAKAAARAMDEYLTIVQEGMDAEPAPTAR